MYNYMITRISCKAVCRYFFVTGACLGGVGGMLLGMMERQVISILGGLFLGLLAAVIFAVTGWVFAATFNVLSPVIGGIAIQVTPVKADTVPEQTTENTSGQQSLFPGE